MAKTNKFYTTITLLLLAIPITTAITTTPHNNRELFIEQTNERQFAVVTHQGDTIYVAIKLYDKDNIETKQYPETNITLWYNIQGTTIEYGYNYKQQKEVLTPVITTTCPKTWFGMER